MREKLSLPMARRIALAAQGFAEQRPAGPVDRRHLNRVLARLGLLQIDSVSAVVRAHYMPLFSRLGPYPMSLLDDAASGKKRRLFEYWAHEASFLPLETWPLMTWRMERAGANDKSEIYGGLARWAAEKRSLIEDIYTEVKTRGPIAASSIEGAKGKGGWWGWSDEKHAFEWLFWAGRITTHSRRGFERLYDLPERVIPPDIFNAPAPKPEDAHRELLRMSARALGRRHLWRPARLLPPQPRRHEGPAGRTGRGRRAAAGQSRGLEAAGLPAHRRRRCPEKSMPARCSRHSIRSSSNARAPNACSTSTTASRSTRPAEKRQYGYYVLPFLLGDTIVARVDVKADRPAGVLRVLATYAQPGAPPETAAETAG